MDPLLDAILEHVPPPPGNPDGPFSMLVTLTERDSFLGRVATGRIASGQVKVGDKLKVLRHNGEATSARIAISCLLVNAFSRTSKWMTSLLKVVHALLVHDCTCFA